MKKVFAILMVMALVAGAVFAAPGDGLKLKSTVGEVLPVYIIKATDSASEEKIGADPAVVVTTGKDISTVDITWDFIISQIGEVDSASTPVTFAKTKKTATLTVTLGNFKGENEGVTAANNPVFTAFAAVAPAGDNATVEAAKKTVVTVPKADSGSALNSGNTYISTLAYKGVNWADQDVLTFTAKWTKDPTIPMDDYYADVTLEYTIE